jgi:uncharacterized protein YjiS (DUF1127 family)
MRTTTATGAAASAVPILATAAAVAPVAVIARWWAAMRQRSRDRLTRRILESLDDRTLRDIGIDRTEIGSIVKTRAYGRRWPYYDFH